MEPVMARRSGLLKVDSLAMATAETSEQKWGKSSEKAKDEGWVPTSGRAKALAMEVGSEPKWATSKGFWWESAMEPL